MSTNLYYDLTSGVILGYAYAQAVDPTPPAGQGVVLIPDGMSFTDQQGRVCVHFDLPSGKVALNT
jgi:hypothetical protein